MEYKQASKRELIEFETYFIDNNYPAISKYLSEGYDPNICVGVMGWMDSNPLWIAADDERENIQIIQLLIDSGADVNMRPYIWRILDHRILTEEDIAWLNDIKGDEEKMMSGTTAELMYRKVEILLEAGADPDYKGARNRLLYPSTDSNYKKYFEREGSRPVNYAISKNLPLIVDLLLQYTTLDEESLKAAEMSKNAAMIEKILNICKIQQEKS
jgi:hypothetical protein